MRVCDLAEQITTDDGDGERAVFHLPLVVEGCSRFCFLASTMLFSFKLTPASLLSRTGTMRRELSVGYTFVSTRSLHATSTNGRVSQQEATHHSVTRGRNYAGLLASFDETSGDLVPLPVHYIPKAMMEWGVVPTVLEVLSFEDNNKRTQTIVFPETGCGVDDLKTLVTFEDLEPIKERNGDKQSPLGNIVIEKNNKNKRIYEAVFPQTNLDDSLLVEDDARLMYRCRVRIPITERRSGAENDSTYGGPIDVIVERHVVEEDTRNIAVAKHGGFDGQSVARWLGPQLSSQKWHSFGETRDKGKKSPKGVLSLPLGVSVEINPSCWIHVSKVHCGSVRFELSPL